MEKGYNMRSLIVRWIIVAVALILTAYLVPGIRVEGNGFIVVLGMAVILGFVNAFIKPLLTFLSCGFVILTLGLFLLVINALSFWLASWMAQNWFGLGFIVEGFLPALLGSIVVSIISFVLSLLVKGEPR
jgi:putative membrane protein